MKKRLLSAAVAALCASTAQVHAAGFQLAEYSATGMGRAFAGEAAIADNASAQGRNAALLTDLKGRQISAGVIYIMPNVDVPGDIVVEANGTEVSRFDASASDVANEAAVPNFYYSNQLNDKLTWGLAINSNYGLATEIGEDHAAAVIGQHTSIKSVEFNPNIAYKVNDQFSIGGGVRIVYGEGELNASVPTWLSAASGLPAGTSLKHLKGDDLAFGWQLGTTYQLNEQNRIGLAYHSGVKFDLEGSASGATFVNAQGQPDTFDGRLPIELPAFAELSTYHQLTNKFAVHTSINWTEWSTFEELRGYFPSAKKPLDPTTGQPMNNQLIKEENFEDNWRYAVGATYQINEQWLARAGIAVDNTAVSDEYRTTTIPDSDRLWYSIGAGYKASKNLTIDMSATYIKAHGDAAIHEEVPVTGDVHFEGNAEGDVILVGVQASYRF